MHVYINTQRYTLITFLAHASDEYLTRILYTYIISLIYISLHNITHTHAGVCVSFIRICIFLHLPLVVFPENPNKHIHT